MAWSALAAVVGVALVPVAAGWGTAGADAAQAARAGAGDPGEVLARLPGRAPATDAQRVAYVGADGVLRVRDVWLGTSLPVATPGVRVEDVRLAGGHLAFLSAAGEGGLLALWSGPVDGPFAAVRSEAGQLSPALGPDGAVAWLDLADEQTDLWWRGPEGGARALTSDAAGQSEPAVAPGWVAWTDTRNTSPLSLAATLAGRTALHPSNLDIYVLDTATGLPLQLTDEPLEQIHPTFAGGRVVYLSQEGGRYGAFHRDPAQGVRQARVALGEPAWRPFLLDGDGERVVLLDGTQTSATLRVLDVASGARLGEVAGIENALRLEASAGVAVVESVAADGSREVVVVRLPSALAVRVAASAPGGPGGRDGAEDASCWRVTATGATGALRVLHDAGGGDGPVDVPVVDGAAHVCGSGTVRLVDDAGASAAMPLREAKGHGAPAVPAALLLVLVAAVAAYARRR